jgi:hypothetical protein
MVSVSSLRPEEAKPSSISYQDRRVLEDLIRGTSRRSKARKRYIEENLALVSVALTLVVIVPMLVAIHLLDRYAPVPTSGYHRTFQRKARA